MKYGTGSDAVDSQTSLKKVRGKVHTNTKTFPAQEPVSQLRLAAGSVWMDALPTDAQLIDAEQTLWDAFNADIANNGSPQDYYTVEHAGFNISQVLVRCQPNSGTEYYSFDILDNAGQRVDDLIITSFGNHFQPRLWVWDGSTIGKQVSPISGVYWQIDAGGYLYTSDQNDPDYSSSGYYLIMYRYHGAKLSQGAANTTEYNEEVIPTSGQTVFTITNVPIATTVKMYVCGALQSLGADYTVDAGNRTVTWVSTDFTLDDQTPVTFIYNSEA